MSAPPSCDIRDPNSDTTDLGVPSMHGRSGDPDLPARLASAHPGLEQWLA